MYGDSNKLKWYTKAAYGFGEVGSQFSWGMVSSYLTIFYTDVVGLAPAVISFIMILARVWDAVNDPMFGAIAERTNSRWGRFRPYILFGCPVLALFNCLAFLNLDIPMIWKTLWCTLTYIGCGMAYTAVNISVGCLANSMTTKNTERVTLNAVKGAMGSAGGMLLGGTTLALIRSFQYTFKDRNARLLIMAEFCFLTGVFGRLGIMSYYFVYILKQPGLMASFSVMLSLGMLLANGVAAFLMAKMDKKWVGVLSSVCQAICCALFYVVGEAGLTYLVAPIGFLYGITNLSGNVAYGMSAEIIDDNWLATGVRSDGVIYSCISFSTKLGNAIGGAVGILALGAVGFISNVDLSSQVLTSMDKVINFGPAAFFILSAFFFAKNGMTNAKGVENELRLAEMTSR